MVKTKAAIKYVEIVLILTVTPLKFISFMTLTVNQKMTVLITKLNSPKVIKISGNDSNFIKGLMNVFKTPIMIPPITKNKRSPV